MYKRKPVKDWEELAGQEIMLQVPQPFEMLQVPVRVGITFYYKYDRDIDAGVKVLLDLFQKQYIYLNDRQVREIMYIKIFEDKKNPRAEVEIEAL